MKTFVVTFLFLATASAAQEDAVAMARRLALAGDRAKAISILEERLRVAPNDTGARTLYGTVLSWNRDFARARKELERVLRDQPQNLDARLALARVEVWSNHPRRAQELLSGVAGPDADALIAQARREIETNELSVGITYDDFDHSDPWSEEEVNLKKGVMVFRVAHGARFGLSDDQLEAEAYPRINTHSYAYLGASVSRQGDLYPKSRFGGEIFGGFGPGFEASIGFRRLNFDDALNITTGSLSKYQGNWLFSARGYHSTGSTSVQGTARYYFGRNWVALRLGKGASRDEIRSLTDVQVLDAFDAAIEARIEAGAQWVVHARAGAGHRNGENHKGGSLLLGVKF